MDFKESVISLALVTWCMAVVAYEQERANISQEIVLARSNSTYCLNQYREATERATRVSELMYNKCQEDFEEQKLNVQAACWDKSKILSCNTNKSCSSLRRCNDLSSAEEALKCVEIESVKSAKIMDSIRRTADKYLFDLKEILYLIKNNEYRCINDTKECFNEELAQANYNLVHCLKSFGDNATIRRVPADSKSHETPD